MLAAIALWPDMCFGGHFRLPMTKMPIATLSTVQQWLGKKA